MPFIYIYIFIYYGATVVLTRVGGFFQQCSVLSIQSNIQSSKALPIYQANVRQHQ
ncbi:hypothetical protein ASPSYDRAFT_933692 [Aspergillus sydowii CBS 593.65]|uniref:Uncharacterized protein n=1 Tax=Aspergillus sydowii CBS 593.65 TaxID=1036612 RepID=A0A1L9TL94_9EURO|nr:uncharacterized protein ASPSYDRAFT_933692 [Aspergillus sydowii CBS 593.65]OJJ60200.1 hypothetical protein ASPSYDRAFT_933692 [Aspergillus sydowii CBS 593.65]